MWNLSSATVIAHPDPGWTDVRFGVFICIECSGIHRGLGSHLAQVKSLTLDEFTDENVTVSGHQRESTIKFMFEMIVPCLFSK